MGRLYVGEFIMRRKRCMAVFLTLIIAASGLSACGKKNKNKSTEEASVTEAVTEDTQAPINLTKTYKRGRVNGQKYKNEFFNFSCDFDEGWRVYNDEEIDQINQFQAGAATDENVALVLEESYLLDMAAARYDGKGSISMIVRTIQTDYFSERDYAESGMDAAAESLRQSGYTDVKAEIGSAQFCGRERVSINISAVSPPDASAGDATRADAEKEADTNSAEDRRIFEKQLTTVNGKYICVLTFKADSEKEVDEIIKLFK